MHTRTPSKNGGWAHGYAIHLPGSHHVVRDGLLGSRDDPKSEHQRLAGWLRGRRGDACTTEEKV